MDRMGFFSKLFKKKKKDDAPKAAGAKESAAAPVAKEEPLPTEPVPRAIALARKANNDNVAAGKYDDKRAGMYAAAIDAVEASEAPEDAKIVELSQIRGGMTRGAIAVANSAPAQ